MDTSAVQRPNIVITPPPSELPEASPSGAGSMFKNVLDVVNPLHHIPVVSTLYEAASGDRPNPVPRILGGLLFGGVIGMVLGIANSIIQEASGKDIGGNILAMVKGEGGNSPDAVNSTQEAQIDMRGNTVNPYLQPSFFASNDAPPASGSSLDISA